jgi:hypothetical protein
MRRGSRRMTDWSGASSARLVMILRPTVTVRPPLLRSNHATAAHRGGAAALVLSVRRVRAMRGSLMHAALLGYWILAVVVSLDLRAQWTLAVFGPPLVLMAWLDARRRGHAIVGGQFGAKSGLGRAATGVRVDVGRAGAGGSGGRRCERGCCADRPRIEAVGSPARIHLGK